MSTTDPKALKRPLVQKTTDLKALKRRLMQKTAKPLLCKVSRDGEPVSEHRFTQEVVKVGKLLSSTLVLDHEDVALMHAVFERSGNTWRVIDLGSASGIFLDDGRVHKHVQLPPTGRMTMGPFDIDFSIGNVPLKALDKFLEGGPEALLSEHGRDHHKVMMDSLMGEMKKLSPKTYSSASFMEKGWHLFDDVKKRKYLRMMVDTIRESRAENKKFAERSAAAMLAFGADGIEAIYDASPQDALAKAHETLQDMANARHSLELLRGMNLMEGITQATEVAAERDADALQSLVYFKKGHENLLERLETIIAAGTTILIACVSRAGGAELSDEDRAKMQDQWDAISTATTK